MNKRLVWLCFAYLFSCAAHADEIHVGSVLNFIAPLEEMGRLFEKNSGHKVTVHRYAMDDIYAQAVSNNTLDIVLLADAKSAQTLEESGVALEGSRFTYAVGKLALWSNQENLIDSKGEVLSKGKFNYLALPNIKENPYGIAAYRVLINLGSLARLEKKLLIGGTVVDSRQQVIDNKAELAFTALSILNPQKKIDGSLWIVPQKYYPPLKQQGVLLKRAQNDKSAVAFLNFMKTPAARNIIEKYGYSVP
ncbi:MAG: molybdate ABC transporter substrate-binding protein [Thiotrichaceae bacterium]|nr:molybdate ABC transporter substrate-binding protein [Thiotrichaceae bacterium]